MLFMVFGFMGTFAYLIIKEARKTPPLPAASDGTSPAKPPTS